MAKGCKYAEIWLDPDSQIDLYARIEGQVVQVRVVLTDPRFVISVGSLPQMMAVYIDTDRDDCPETGVHIYRDPETKRIVTEIEQTPEPELTPEQGAANATPDTTETPAKTEGPGSTEPGEEHPADEDLQD